MEHRKVLKISTIVLAMTIFSLARAKPGMAYARSHVDIPWADMAGWIHPDEWKKHGVIPSIITHAFKSNLPGGEEFADNLIKYHNAHPEIWREGKSDYPSQAQYYEETYGGSSDNSRSHESENSDHDHSDSSSDSNHDFSPSGGGSGGENTLPSEGSGGSGGGSGGGSDNGGGGGDEGGGSGGGGGGY